MGKRTTVSDIIRSAMEEDIMTYTEIQKRILMQTGINYPDAILRYAVFKISQERKNEVQNTAQPVPKAQIAGEAY